MQKMTSSIYPITSGRVSARPADVTSFDVPPRHAKQMMLKLIALAKTTKHKQYVLIITLDGKQIFMRKYKNLAKGGIMKRNNLNYLKSRMVKVLPNIYSYEDKLYAMQDGMVKTASDADILVGRCMKRAAERPNMQNTAVMDVVFCLAGDHNKNKRQEIFQQLTGQKQPKSKCGVNAIAQHIYKNYIEK
jgi:hypothetical protein